MQRRSTALQLAILTYLFLFANPLFAEDVIIMKNGDRMTGSIKSLNSGVLYVSLDYVDGNLSVEWSKVARVESTQSFLVRTDDGSVYTGKLATVETPSQGAASVRVVPSEGEAVEIDQSRIVRVGPTSERFWQRFNGAINTGIAYSKGNQSTQFNVGADAEYPRPRWAAYTSLNSNLTTSSGTNASTRNQFNFTPQHLLPWNNWYYAGLAAYLQSSVQGISSQTTFGGGIGHFLTNSNRSKISALAGLGWQSTHYQHSITAQPTQNDATGVLAGQLKFFKFKKTNGTLTAVLLPALSEPGRVRLNLNSSYYLKIFGNLSWNASFYGNFDHKPPTTFAGSDYGSTSGFSWTFGNR